MWAKLDRESRSLLAGLFSVLLIPLAIQVNAAPTVFISDINGVKMYDDQNGDYLGIFGDTSGEFVMGLVSHPITGNLLVGHSQGFIQEYDGETGALIGIFGNAADHLSSPIGLLFHPVSGNLLILEDGGSPKVQEYDGTTGNFISHFGDTAANLTPFVGNSMAISPITGNLLVSDRSDVKEFSGTTGAFVGVFGDTAANLGSAVDIAFDPVGGNLFVADRSNDDIREFEATSGAFIKSHDGGGAINNPISIAFRPAVSAAVPSFGPPPPPLENLSDVDYFLHVLHAATFREEVMVLDLLTGLPLFIYGGDRLSSALVMHIKLVLALSAELTHAIFGQAGVDRDPVNTFTGELFAEPIVDLSFGGPLPLIFSRYYASNLRTDGNIRSSLGDNWLHNFDMKLTRTGSAITVVTNRGRVINFEKNAENWALVARTDIAYQLAESGADFVLSDPLSGLMYTFNTKGKLTLIEDGRGNAQTLLYSDEGMLNYVTDTLAG
jgi:DNA-binding beta-propeller fold protein YncE